MDKFDKRFEKIEVFYVIKASKIGGNASGYVVDFNTCELKTNLDWKSAYIMKYPYDAKATYDFLRTKFEDYKFEILQMKIEIKEKEYL